MDATDNGVLVTQYYGCWVVDFYHRSRTHLALDKDAPGGRPVQPASDGRIVAMTEDGVAHRLGLGPFVATGPQQRSPSTRARRPQPRDQGRVVVGLGHHRVGHGQDGGGGAVVLL